ncbi:MAG: ketose-bisphosphate aldolase [Promethearchaeota archaeon]|nr:MAG: ketose-bisphosphate aldolase [Candidatus Lokiarchaeota archaeon]
MTSFKELGLCNTKKMFEIALNKHFAIPGYNVSNLEQFQAIILGCGETNSPVILQINPTSLKYLNPIILKHLIKGCVEMVKDLGYQIPIALHLDHGNSFELCKLCIDYGFSSVMIDGSHLDYEENIKLTKQVVRYAKERDVCVEAELGIVGRPDKLTARDPIKFTDPDKAKEFIIRTGCNSLAIAIGTSHGAYKFTVEKASEVPELRFDILQEIKKKVGNFPIVLHGASSVLKEFLDIINSYGGSIKYAFGVPETQLRKAAQLGICKINIATDSRLLFTAMVRKYLFQHPDHFDPRQYLGHARGEIIKMIRRKNIEVLGSAEQAKYI